MVETLWRVVEQDGRVAALFVVDALWRRGTLPAMHVKPSPESRSAGGAERAEPLVACPPPLARRLHDIVAQPLCSVLFALASSAPLGPAERRRCATEVETALSNLRSLIVEGDVRAAGDDAPTTVAAVIRDAHPGESRAPIELRMHGDAIVSRDAEMLVRDFIVETIRNAAAHAQPSRISVTLHASDAEIALEVENDGVGARSPRLGTGLGIELLGIHAAHLGGTVVAGASDRETWRTALMLPVESPPLERRRFERGRGE